MISFRAKSTIVIAAVLLIGALASMWHTMEISSTRIHETPFIGVGQVLAEGALKQSSGRGRIVAVISRDHQQLGNPSQVEWEAFQKVIQKSRGVRLESEIVVPDPNDPGPNGGCPIEAYHNIMARYAEADVIVFFLGLPQWHWLEERGMVPAIGHAKTLVFDISTMSPKFQYDQYLTQGLVNELIIGWGGSPNQVEKPRTPREWFDKQYQIFTPENARSLPN